MKARARAAVLTATLMSGSGGDADVSPFEKAIPCTVTAVGAIDDSLLAERRWLLLVDAKEAPGLQTKHEHARCAQDVRAKGWNRHGYDGRGSKGQDCRDERNDCELCEDGIDPDVAVLPEERGGELQALSDATSASCTNSLQRNGDAAAVF